jgi:hypothetical protein
MLKVEREFQITKLMISVPVRYDEEDIPNNFPGRSGDILNLTIDLDENQIENYSWKEPVKLYMKVVDEGVYSVYGIEVGTGLDGHDNEKIILEREGYVPGCIGKWGDYLVLNIEPDGKLTNFKFVIEDFVEEET